MGPQQTLWPPWQPLWAPDKPTKQSLGPISPWQTWESVWPRWHIWPCSQNVCRPTSRSCGRHLQLKSKVRCLNDNQLVHSRPVTKCFKRLIVKQINSYFNNDLKQIQFTYGYIGSTVDVVSLTLPSALANLDNRKTYVSLLFINYLPAFNIIPSQLIINLGNWVSAHPTATGSSTFSSVDLSQYGLATTLTPHWPL